MTAQEATRSQDDILWPVAVYVLLMLGSWTIIAPIVAGVIAHWRRGSAPEWLWSHYTFQIYTFWLSLLGGVLSIVLWFLGLKWIALLIVAGWVFVRCVLGLVWLGRRQEVPDPESWMFGRATGTQGSAT